MNIQQHGSLGPRGELQGQVTRELGVLTARHVAPVPSGWRWRNWLRYRRRDLPKLAASRLLGTLPGLLSMEATLQGAVYRAHWAALAPWQAAKLRELLAANVNVFELPAHFGGVLTNYGVLSTRVVTNAGVAFLVDGFQNLVELENLKYHGFGTGNNAEDATDTALETELTTEYASDNTRPTGSTTEGASANIYRSVARCRPMPAARSR